MKNFLLAITVSAAAVLFSNSALAATFTPNFSDYPFPGTQFTVDAAANAYYNTNYGISISNAYLYKDSRDTFDGIGISVGTVPEIGTPQTGRIDFTDGGTNFVTVQGWAIQPTTYTAYASDGTALATQSLGDNINQEFTLNGGSSLIAYLTWSSNGGFGQISGMTYNYDGKTDGHNDDVGAVPVPAAVWLFGSAIGGLGFTRRRSA